MQIAAYPGAAEIDSAVSFKTPVQPDIASHLNQVCEQSYSESIEEGFSGIFRVAQSRAAEVEIEADFRVIEKNRAHRMKAFAHAEIVANS